MDKAMLHLSEKPSRMKNSDLLIFLALLLKVEDLL